MQAAETLRSREVYRYYQPKNLEELSDVSETPSGISDLTSQQHPFRTVTNFNTQQSFSDTALTAFTQLIALRLESQRAIVSLIDHENEYFLAESTSTFGLIGDDGTLQNAWLSISGARVPRKSSLCEQTLQLVPNQNTPAEMTPVFLVPDLRLDEKMSELDCVKGAPYLRFYCGVALMNREGINIGCVYVVDDRPRTDFSLEQAQFLTGMAATVMDHLENIRAKEDIVRVTRMSQALHAFIEGDGTMDGDWQRLKKYNLPSGAGVGFHWESNKKEVTGGYFNDKKELRPAVLVRSVPSSSGSEFSMSPGLSPLQHTEGISDSRSNFDHSPWNSASDVLPQLPLKSVFEVIDAAALSVEKNLDDEFNNDGFFNLLHTTFSRASNLVREGMEVDGAVFFDAPFRFYQGRSTLETDPRRPKTNEIENSSDSGEEDSQDERPKPRISTSRHPETRLPRRTPSHENFALLEAPALLELKSDILGFSTQGSSSWKNGPQETPDSFTAIDQSLLTALVRRYPAGELFVFDEDGPVSIKEPPFVSNSKLTIPSPDAANRSARRKERIRAEVLRLLDAFPRARQIFFVPLYDSTSGCFIGSFAWSTSATRIFSTENHLSYLVAFGHSVMSEVSRLNTLSADRAKGDFINNVSHELRSPLHGILASAEFLADTTLDGFQRNLIDTVEICGRTLLDTIEHVLDFSKIKKFGQESIQPMGVVADLDISAVIEEVLEGIFAGFEFNGLSSKGLADTTTSRTREMSTSASGRLKRASSGQPGNSLLTVILDIDFREQWKFPTVPGTWRRLTMNIFGNALKYTHAGYIKVKLEARSISPVNSHVKNDGIERTLVTLTISDSGQGMSSEFLKTKLFMPFSQEDVTGPGTGLGMSIVKQIVDLAGGRIDIKSEKGKGTEVKLSLPLEDCPREPESYSIKLDPLSHEDPIIAARLRAAGRTVIIRGFDPVLGSSALQSIALADLKSSIMKYVSEWFNLRIIPDDGNADTTDIVICNESEFLSSSVTEGRFRALLILCSSGARRDIYTAHLNVGQNVEFVSKPCGPHRLAKALLNCLETKGPVTVSSKDDPSIEFSTSIPQSETYSKAETQSYLRLPVKRSRHSQRNILLAKIDPESIETTSTTNSEDYSMVTSPESSTSFRTEEHVIENTKAEMKPKVLLVEDNPVNMMLLSTYMKKNNWDFEMATNGLIAVQAFQSRIEGFDVILMDVSMPIMTGYEATREIRKIESERRLAFAATKLPTSPYAMKLSPPSPSFPFHFPVNSRSASSSTSPSAFSPMELDSQILAEQLERQDRRLECVNNKPALIIALTGFSSEKDQKAALEAGMDVFMTKPVKFKEVGRILDGWLSSR